MKKYLLFFVFSLILGIGFSSCSKDPDYDVFGTLHGIVVDDASAECIPGATVTLSPGGKTQTTGSDGRYQFTDVEPIQYTVTVQKPGYSTNRKMITVIAGEATEANITLHRISE